jgi:ribosomal protein S18 acetylase RimI-like enzyme
VSVELRPPREDEWGEWYSTSREHYADSIHRHGGIPLEHAQQKAVDDFAHLLPNGVESEGQFVFLIEDDGVVRGSLWLCEREGMGGGRHLFVYEVRVDEDARGRGLGRAAMQIAERLARERGLERIELNVFGGNDVARGLYRSLGYDEVAVYMGKDL